MHGCGWDSGAARERSSALAASVASRYELGADGVGAARPGARGSRVTASRYALGAEGGGAARPGAYMCPPRNCARCLLGGGGDVEDVVRCALLERLGARRASSSCGGRGWGGTPRGPCCHRLRHTRAEHRYGGSWQEGGARAASPPLQGLAPPARRPRAAGAPWEARARAARVQTAGEDLVWWWWWWWWCAHQLRITSGRLPLIGGSISPADLPNSTARPAATLDGKAGIAPHARPVFPRIGDQCRRRSYLVRAPQRRYAVARSPCRDASRLSQLLTAARASHAAVPAAVFGIIAQSARGPRHMKNRLRVRLRSASRRTHMARSGPLCSRRWRREPSAALVYRGVHRRGCERDRRLRRISSAHRRIPCRLLRSRFGTRRLRTFRGLAMCAL